jgi:hypothetical protein
MKDMARIDLLLLWIDVVEEDALGPYRLTSQHRSSTIQCTLTRHYRFSLHFPRIARLDQ